MTTQAAFEDRSIEYSIGGKTLIMYPLPFVRLKVALKLIEGVGAKLVQAGVKDPVDFVREIVPLLAGKFNELAPILFPDQGVTDQWIEQSISIPVAKQILYDAARINDVIDFLVHLRGKMETPAPQTSHTEKV